MWRDAAGHLVALLRQTAPPDGDATTLAQGSTMLSQGPTGSAPGTASVYKMRLRADPHRSQITYAPAASFPVPPGHAPRSQMRTTSLRSI